MLNKRTNIEWTSYLACAYAEGFGEGENATADEAAEAWAYLIETGECWSLQGWYGRSAQSIISKGLISKEGVINWEKVDKAKTEENT
jgi:hypothetical protein